MFNKFEITVGIFSIIAMAFGLFAIQTKVNLSELNDAPQSQQAAAGIVVVSENAGQAGTAEALLEASNNSGKLENLVIDDVLIGVGDQVVEKGDEIIVNYIGRLRNGTEFDNSYTRGEPFTFKVGDRKVISGWDEGVIGMKVGGQRILVIPSDMAYGDDGYGPIPPKATLVFAIELLEIK
ncbi:FKBP-type peptidyl-prolyl cis-trans isomerase [Candidatus Kaiserbacteria bacterium]|nr:FKBP-type peptidyl-prolyl cis-trans isomerase [Candidatus Kaiserbacteria bacterium]